MEDREILDVIQALAAEERRLRQQLSEGLFEERSGSDRLRRVERELGEMWQTLRERRAARAAEQQPGEIDLQDSDVIAS